MKLFLGVNDKHADQILKCKLALAFTGLKYEEEAIPERLQHCGPYLREVPEGPNAGEGERVFSANAICRYVSARADVSLAHDDLAVDEWLEFEELELAPTLSKVQSPGDMDDIALAAMEVLLKSIDAKISNSSDFVVDDKISLADIVLGVTLRTALAVVSTPKLPNLSRYIQTLWTTPVFQSLTPPTTTPATPEHPSLTPSMAQGDSQDSILYILYTLFAQAVAVAYPHVNPISTHEIARVKDPRHKAEYQCNSAMAIYKHLKSTRSSEAAPKSPRDVGLAILAAVPENAVISKCEVAGPGFVNIFLTKTFVQHRVATLLREGVQPMPGQKKLKIVVDFSSPNIAKDMHVGHLRSTIIGDAMCRILEFEGHEVVRTNHVGDWGTQFGMLICYLLDEYPSWQDEMPDITDLTLLYKNAKARFDEDESFKARSREKVVALQSGTDPESLKAWTILCDISRLEFQKVYDRLDVKLTEFGESKYNPMIPQVIDILKSKDMLENSGGAQVVFTDVCQQPFMMVKSDGSYLYDSTDLAAIWYRLTQLSADWIIYYTDYTQCDHFKLFFEVARRAGILHPEPRHRVNHIGFGTVNDESGKRFKTRSGETVRLVDLLDESKDRMKVHLLERIAAGQTSLPAHEVEAAAEQIGYGAVKYFDLKQSPTSNYVFSFDRMLNTQGDTAVYLLFAYARLSSIIRKSDVDMAKLSQEALVDPIEPAEWALAVELLQFQDVLAFIKKDLMSNRLCAYLYSLAEKTQTFVTTCRVLHSEEQNARLLLCQATVHMMKLCFNLLGIKPLDQI